MKSYHLPCHADTHVIMWILCSFFLTEVKSYILEFVILINKKRVYVDYKMVQALVKSVLKREVPIHTIRRYSKESGIKWEKPRDITLRDG